MRLRRTLLAMLGLALLAPAAAAAEDFDPSDEFKLKDWVPIHLGPINMSINKAVVYLLVGAALSIADRDRDDALAPRHRRRDAADRRRGDLRHRLHAGRRDRPADQGDAALVPVLRDAC